MSAFLSSESNRGIPQIVLFWSVQPTELVLLYLAAINLITFFVFGLDKWKAKRKAARNSIRRVPEKTLFLLALLGGSIGALLGMRVWHHKTLHKSFRFGIPFILLLQCLLLLFLRLYPRLSM